MPHLCKYMPEPKRSRRLAPDPENEPNFYQISQLFPLPDQEGVARAPDQALQENVDAKPAALPVHMNPHPLNEHSQRLAALQFSSGVNYGSRMFAAANPHNPLLHVAASGLAAFPLGVPQQQYVTHSSFDALRREQAADAVRLTAIAGLGINRMQRAPSMPMNNGQSTSSELEAELIRRYRSFHGL